MTAEPRAFASFEAAFAMARAKLSGTPDPAVPLDAYLARLAGWAAGGEDAR